MLFYTFIYLNKFAEAIYFSDRNSSTVCKIRTEKVENIQLVVFLCCLVRNLHILQEFPTEIRWLQLL